jgi:hypothetical protein
MVHRAKLVGESQSTALATFSLVALMEIAYSWLGMIPSEL